MSPANGDEHGGGIGESVARLVATETRNFAGAVGERAAAALRDRLSELTERLTDIAENTESPMAAAAAKGAQEWLGGASLFKAALSGGLAAAKTQLKQLFGLGRTKSRKLKVTNIVESVDVGVPVRVAYNQWTEFEDIPRFTKKVEKVDRGRDDTKLAWRAQIFLSHRNWEADIIEMVPDERIVWRSKGAKGHVDGAISFHAVTPTLTRVVLVLQYYPKGLFERTGNLWRAQGRRTRLELKHFVRHATTQTILHPDGVEGWRGEIRDSKVVVDHDAAVRQERWQREAGHEPGHGPERRDGGERDGPDHRHRDLQKAGSGRERRSGEHRPARRPEE
ncbi:SRPBCC family protein [Dactylosporangium roseum]|uniref:SRPBCC family protein n=1 Tax=Dactylosporangium roseum TaxID=47989 RepID=A0ABY5YYX7_9ACTN|nr:SRPBCC family protein [Dactylosporangium roseum]UWZ33434.1 SRPBCC family protein [Dactylosporangium roseum]